MSGQEKGRELLPLPEKKQRGEKLGGRFKGVLETNIEPASLLCYNFIIN